MESPTSHLKASNIERKVLNKCFSAKANDIQALEESTSRLVGTLMKTPTPESRIATEFSRFSLSDDFGGLLYSRESSKRDNSGLSILKEPNPISKAPIEPLVGLTQKINRGQSILEDAPESLEKTLQGLIDASEEGSTITLPAEIIEAKSLIITKPVNFRGEAGAVLVISGSIVIDFDRPYSEPVIFSELSLKHEFEISRSNQPCALFVVGDYYSHLELNDCMLTGKPDAVGALGVQNVGIWMHGKACKSKHVQSSEGYSCNVTVKSSAITGFHFAFYGGINSRATFERCRIAESKGSGIFSIQPKFLHVIKCTIEKNLKSGIELNLIEEGSTPSTIHSSPSTSANRTALREVLITECNFKSNSQHGVKVRSHSLACSSLELSVTHSSFTNMRKEALTLRHIVLLSLQVTHNTFKHNQASHLWLQKVYPSSISNRFLIAHNTCADSVKGYGIYMYSSVSDLIKNECFRNGLGGIFVVAPKNYQGLAEVSIQKCSVYSNGENGISVANYSSGELSSTRVFDNCSSGILMVTNTEPTSKSSVVIKECEVYQNHEYGLVLNKSPCVLSETFIKDNTRGAVFLDEESRPHLVFREPGRMNDLVKGTIGGSWGQHQPSKKGCSGECVLL